MSDNEKATPSLNKIASTFELLDETSKELIKLMDEQIDAVVSSDARQVSALTEAHTTMIGQFKKHEKAFIDELKMAVAASGDLDQPVKLAALKSIFPQAATRIDGWKEILTANTRKLQQKHYQLVQLLEFALTQNSRMMQSIYNMFNEKNAHYSADGGKQGVTPGIAINQEV